MPRAFARSRPPAMAACSSSVPTARWRPPRRSRLGSLRSAASTAWSSSAPTPCSTSPCAATACRRREPRATRGRICCSRSCRWFWTSRGSRADPQRALELLTLADGPGAGRHRARAVQGAPRMAGRRQRRLAPGAGGGSGRTVPEDRARTSGFAPRDDLLHARVERAADRTRPAELERRLDALETWVRGRQVTTAPTTDGDRWQAPTRAARILAPLVAARRVSTELELGSSSNGSLEAATASDAPRLRRFPASAGLGRGATLRARSRDPRARRVVELLSRDRASLATGSAALARPSGERSPPPASSCPIPGAGRSPRARAGGGRSSRRRTLCSSSPAGGGERRSGPPASALGRARGRSGAGRSLARAPRRRSSPCPRRTARDPACARRARGARGALAAGAHRARAAPSRRSSLGDAPRLLVQVGGLESGRGLGRRHGQACRSRALARNRSRISRGASARRGHHRSPDAAAGPRRGALRRRGRAHRGAALPARMPTRSRADARKIFALAARELTRVLHGGAARRRVASRRAIDARRPSTAASPARPTSSSARRRR